MARLEHLEVRVRGKRMFEVPPAPEPTFEEMRAAVAWPAFCLARVLEDDGFAWQPLPRGERRKEALSCTPTTDPTSPR
eukprot:7214827-Alexandrium_andersonii.AAC.1